MSQLITNILNGSFSSSGQTRFFETGANLNVQKMLFDIKFTVPTTPEGGTAYAGKWDFLKKVLISSTLRLGADNGGAVPLIADVPLYDLLEYSDYIAGVSMESTVFTPGSTVRISGMIPLGFFRMNSNDALEVALQVTDQTSVPATVDFTISTVYQNGDTLANLIVYKSAKPTGADMPYKNVLEMFYTGDTVVNKQCSIVDQLGACPIMIEDAIAASNSEGNFEFFHRFGRIYADPYGVSQNLTVRVPTDDSNATVLIVQYAFNNALLSDSALDMEAEKNSLFAKIRTSDPEKYVYLQKLGIVA